MMHDQAILEAPEDDAPRLVSAGWLDDNGQPKRAEFIRVQVALAALTYRLVGQPSRTCRVYSHSPNSSRLRSRRNDLAKTWERCQPSLTAAATYLLLRCSST